MPFDADAGIKLLFGAKGSPRGARAFRRLVKEGCDSWHLCWLLLTLQRNSQQPEPTVRHSHRDVQRLAKRATTCAEFARTLARASETDRTFRYLLSDASAASAALDAFARRVAGLVDLLDGKRPAAKDLLLDALLQYVKQCKRSPRYAAIDSLLLELGLPGGSQDWRRRHPELDSHRRPESVVTRLEINPEFEAFVARRPAGPQEDTVTHRFLCAAVFRSIGRPLNESEVYGPEGPREAERREGRRLQAIREELGLMVSVGAIAFPRWTRRPATTGAAMRSRRRRLHGSPPVPASMQDIMGGVAEDAAPAASADKSTRKNIKEKRAQRGVR